MINECERRFSQRFEMKLPAIVKPCAGANGSDHHLLLTRDISDQGAYFNIMDNIVEPLAYAGHVQVEVLLKVPGHENQVNYVYMTALGEVVRHEAAGLAVRFDREASLMPFSV